MSILPISFLNLHQIDIYKDLSNYEPNNPTDLLPKKPSQIDHRPDQKINNYKLKHEN